MIRIVLAEDQAMVRGALVALLKLEPDFDIVADAADGELAWDLVKLHKPDLVVIGNAIGRGNPEAEAALDRVLALDFRGRGRSGQSSH